ncbi:LuxR C-terminal-related transcriptional regulator [Bacteroides uniformis]|nr:LuxR C-terminal-related transcriptional regulator [Bacteroides uniformis]
MLAYLSQGLSTSEISQLLFLSINTIQTYRKRPGWKNWRPKTLQNLSTRGRAYSENICHSSGQLQTSNFSIFSV